MMRQKWLAIFVLLFAVALVFGLYLAEQSNSEPLRVACLGDSITAGYTLYSGYPLGLQRMLGANYTVGNFGAVASTLMLDTIKPYFHEPKFEDAMEFKPNVVVIMLGTNDAHILDYLNLDKFISDYETLINETNRLANHPKIFLVMPPPIFNNELNLSNANLIDGIIPSIQQVANEEGLQTIDIYSALAGHPEYFVDGVHPTKEGSNIIAHQIYNAIIANP